MNDRVGTAALAIDAEPHVLARRDVRALVWAETEKQASEAIDFLRHGLWGYWYLFRVVDIRQLPLGATCPLRRDHPAVLSTAGRERWTWVLVAPEIDPEVVATPCT
jgi:hypothetical protein